LGKTENTTVIGVVKLGSGGNARGVILNLMLAQRLITLVLMMI